MKPFDRRDFIAGAAGAAAALTPFGRISRGAEPVAHVPAPPPTALGKTGITMSRVGQGTGMRGGNRQSNHTRMGFEKFVALMRNSFDRGVSFFDLADLYGTHVYFREALRYIPRDEIAILTKLWWRYDGPVEPVAEAYRKQIAATTIQRFCHEIATDHLDIVLLHCVTTPKWVEELQPYMAALDEAKQKGLVRAVGVSCHDLKALEIAADCDWLDVVLARINFKGTKMDGTPEEVIRVLRKLKAHGKSIIGMKIYGEGQLADQREKCIEFAQNLGLLDAMTVGAEKPGEMDETLRLIHKYPAKVA